jgi:ABC-type phosphate/phosphonate transport system ATPase subunit
VLKGINLKINPGEVIAFVGPSGSGKSSIIRLLQRLVCQIEILNKLLLILLTAYTTQMMEK